jgi:hypothetical protein
MGKLIYNVVGYTNVFNEETEETEKIETFCEVIVENPTTEDIERATEIAYNGEYTIEDDVLDNN